jgi:isocitrate/isopropylmalate dehydrogenase
MQAIEAVTAEGVLTPDLGGVHDTRAVTNAVKRAVTNAAKPALA